MNKGNFMKPKVVLFGTGMMLPQFEELLSDSNIGFYCYTDNNPQKWGTYIRGKKVIPPSKLVEFDNKIIITCGYKYTEQITNQLESMGLKDRIISFFDCYIKKSLDIHIPDFEYLKQIKVNKESERKIIIDEIYGNGWGGIETWSYSVADGLARKDYDVEIISSVNQVKQPEQIERLIKRYKYENRMYSKTISELVKDLSKKMPFVLINNSSGYVFFAAYILKSYFPDYVKIVSVSHGDKDFVYKKLAFWNESFDGIICTTEKMAGILQNNYNVEKEKLYYKELAVNFDEQYKKEYSGNDEPLRIGYAARLVKEQKRADLFPQFLKKLDKQNINYVFEIAGDGSCFDLIKNYVHENEMESRVKLLGFVEKDKMSDFWKKHDVFVNFSEYEGSCFSMMEAMSYGVVPVVTDVSGAQDFVKSGENGFISDVGDFDDMVKNIEYLCNNREKLPEYGNICREEMRTRCNRDDYIDFIEKVCGLN